MSNSRLNAEASPAAQAEAAAARRFGRRLAGVFLLVGVLLAGGGYVYLSHRQQEARAAAHRELSAIADLKLRQISSWRQERISDARFFARARFVADDVRRFLNEPDSPSAKSSVLQWLTLLKNGNRYFAVMIFNTQFQQLLAAPASVGEPAGSVRKSLELALQRHDVIFSDLHRDESNGLIHLDIVLPIFEDADWNHKTPIAVVLLKMDARQFLFPLIHEWPTPSQTAETLLVRREDQSVVYLNDLRYQTGTALALRRPFASPNLPAAQVLRGETRVLEGIDHRGVPVVAAGRRVPGTTWAIVAKMDRQEIYGPVRRQMLTSVAVLVAIWVAAAMLVAFLWRQRSAQLLKRELDERKAHEREIERMNRLYAALNQVNEAVVRATSRDELLQEMCRVLVKYGGFQMAWVGWLDRASSRVFPRAAFGDGDGDSQKVAASKDRPLEHCGPLDSAIRDGRPCVCNDVPEDDPNLMLASREKSGLCNGCSLAAFPIRQQGEIQGALAVFARQKDFFGAQEQALVEEAAADVSFGLDTLLSQQRRRQAEDKLRDRNAELDAERARWKGVVEGIADEVWMCDAKGRMTLMNLPTVTAMELEEFEDKDVMEVLQELEILNPDGSPRSAQDAPLLRSLRGEVLRGEEIMMHRRTGKRRCRQFSCAPTRDATGTITGAVAIVRDITDQRRMEEELRRSEEQLRVAALAGEIGVWSWVPGTNEVAVSANWRRLFGVQTEVQVTFETWRNALHVEDRKRAVRELNAAKEEHRDFNSEYRVVRPDGSVRWLVDRGRASYDEQGRAVRMAGVNVDITERKIAEEALRAARDELARLNAHLERKVEKRTAQLVEANANLQAFAYTAAHDLRSPLRAINSFSSIALEDYGPNMGETCRSMLKRVTESAGQMSRLLEDLLEYSKVSAAELKLQPVNLKQVVTEGLALLAGEIRSKKALVSVIEPLPDVFGHPATIMLLINNLVANGLKFTRAEVQPQIRIRAETLEFQPLPAAASAGLGTEETCPSGNCVRIWVEDNGIGIDPGNLERLFVAFQRLHDKKAYPGTGLGLAIVRMGAERMGGSVGVESELGKGSKFWINLKAAA